jgi:hypothetical protein
LGRVAACKALAMRIQEPQKNVLAEGPLQPLLSEFSSASDCEQTVLILPVTNGYLYLLLSKRMSKVEQRLTRLRTSIDQAK